MKKIELHLHLEGAAPPAFIKGLAAKKHQDVSGIFDARGNYSYRDFRHFLGVYETVTSLLTTPQDYANLLSEVLTAAGEQETIYTELFLSPDFCGGGDLSAWRDYLGATEEVAHRFARDGVHSRGIATAIRHFDPAKSRKAALCAAETAGGWLTGFGLAGAEQVGKAKDFAWAFDCAREAGLGLTAHAGEWGGPDSVRDVLDFGVTRIGHGARAVEDKALLHDLAEREITLECCAGSNIALGLCPDWASHPIARLADAGVRVTVSTDDPPFFHTTLQNEYDRLADAFGWREEDFRRLNHWAIDAAFCDEETRNRLRKELS